MMKETWTDKRPVHRGVIFDVFTGKAMLDNGLEVTREVVEHSGGVGIVPVVDGHVILVRQFRIAVGKPVLELPAGRLEGNESPEHRAGRELEEEIGYRASSLIKVAECYCSPGFTNEKDHIYLAFNLVKTCQDLGHDEFVELVSIPVADIPGMLDTMAFDDAKTVIGLRELLHYLEKTGPA
jgi:ADP-ribose pyrophosphatase